MEIIELFYKIAELTGTVAFAVSGAMVSIQRGLDLFGILFLGAVTAVGGGTIRDIILGKFPPDVFCSYYFLTTALISSLVVFIIACNFKEKYKRNANRIKCICNIFDAVGLGIFSVTGVVCAINAGYADNPFLCVFLGMTTGIGGGVLRDMMTKSIPFVLKEKIYAVAALMGSLIYWLIVRYTHYMPAAMIISSSAVVLIRMLATFFRWNLPKVKNRR